ncbi:acyl-CoA thioesterase [Oceanibacterium hippocampi]|uniref:Bifunctional 3-hydroxyacyl-CoA dehydrogenase/thioesterase n=1 Tax=Oceanibacterium hippocampi TaxID=745714 RepID=A0A1Y5RPW0_9PROT|nr:thioesterase family protein [Oceanibacterium hippocampi]SLN22623.1 bifunctional 3-hydroxyacyl-CoA dehydrogenase/thioesterase [Oceanibacterium hippocampi]
MGDWLESYRGMVESWDCDFVGHMNVRGYVGHARDGLDALTFALGLDPRKARDAGLEFMPVTSHVHFLRERRAGQPISVRTGLAAPIAPGTDTVRVVQEIIGLDDQAISATILTDAAVTRRRDGARLPLSDHLGDGTAHVVAVPPHAEPRSLSLGTSRSAPDLAEAEALGLLRTYVGRIADKACDRDGRLGTPGYIGCVSDSVGGATVALSSTGQMPEGVGGAALEYRLVYRRAAMAGDLVELRSGLREITDKTFIWVHWLFDRATGECLATMENVGALLDLKARRIIRLPESARASLAALRVPGLEA